MSDASRSAGDSLPLSVEQRIDPVCRRFEAAWAAGQRPRIEDYLAELPEPERPALLRELVLLDVCCRRRAGEDPQMDDYQKRFPLLASVGLADEITVQPGPPPPAPAAPTVIPIDSVAALVAALRASGLLELARLAELPQLQAASSEPRALARELLRRNWLTAYQVNQLFQGSGHELVLGHYTLLERLGRGGMGQVFKARHRGLDRIVALKIIRKEHLANPEAIRRFQREIRAVAQLSHPHIVHAYDADHVGDTWFFTMEYVPGTDLKHLVEREGPLPAAHACDYTRQAALGLQHAHERGLIHRDTKPANLLLCRPGPQGSGPGLIKLLDLGLARLRPPGIADGTSSLTIEGGFMGTPDYIAPEQAVNAHKADARADLYSLGCTFYHLLTGRVPFPEGTVQEKIDRHRWDEPAAVEQLRPEVPPAVGAVVRKLMAKQPQDRYQSAAEVAQALLQLTAPPARSPASPRTQASQRRQPAPSPDPFAALVTGDPEGTPWRLQEAARRRRWLWLSRAGAGLLAALLALLLFLVFRNHADFQQPDSPPVPPEERALRELRARAARLGTGGDDLDSFLQDVCALRRKHPDTEQAREAGRLLQELREPLPPELTAVLGEHRGRHWNSVTSVAFSPDGKLLASGGLDRTIRLWDPATLQARGILRASAANVGNVWALAFSPDGRTLAAGWDDGVRLWERSAKGWQERNEPLWKRTGQTAVAFAREGKKLAAGGDTVRLWDLTEQEPQELFRLPVSAKSVAFSPDGKLLACGRGDGTVYLCHLEAEPKPVLLKEYKGAVSAVAFAPEGRRLAVATFSQGIELWDLSGDKPQEQAVLQGAARMLAVAFAPDGRALAAGSEDRVYLWRLDGKEQDKPLVAGGTQGPGPVGALAFAPDGQTLATGHRDGGVGLWDASDLKEKIAPLGHVGAVRSVAFAPGGKVLASGGDTTVQLWTAAEGEFKKQDVLKGHTAQVHSVAFSPDGRRLASGAADDWMVWDLGAGKVQRSLRIGGRVLSIAFSPDGRRLASASSTSPGGKLNLWDAETGKLIRPLEGHAANVRSLAFSPDSKRLASGSEDKTVKVWDWERGQELLTLKGHTGEIGSVAFSPNGERLASGSNDKTVKVWDADKGQLLLTLPGHTERVNAVAFAPKGQVLASAGADSQVILWDMTPGKKELRLKTWQFPGAVWGVAFADDGRHLATANANGTLYVFRLPP